MKTKQMGILLILLVAFSITTIPTIASAADIGSATITKVGFYPNVSAGSSGGIAFLDESNDAHWGGSRMFYLSDALGNQGLATLLTAYSMGKTVFVRIGGSSGADPVAGSLVNIIYVND